MTKIVARKTVSTKKAQTPGAKKAAVAKHDKPVGKKSRKPSPRTMDALDFFVYTYSRF